MKNLVNFFFELKIVLIFKDKILFFRERYDIDVKVSVD